MVAASTRLVAQRRSWLGWNEIGCSLHPGGQAQGGCGVAGLSAYSPASFFLSIADIILVISGVFSLVLDDCRCYRSWSYCMPVDAGVWTQNEVPPWGQQSERFPLWKAARRRTKAT